MRHSKLVLVALLGLACDPGLTSTEGPGDPDPGPGDDPGGDPPPPAVTYDVSGMVYDYETGDPLPSPLHGIAIETVGLEPSLLGANDDTGAFDLTGVPEGSVFYLMATPDGAIYRPTVGSMVNVAATDVVADVRLVSVAFAKRQYATVAMPMTAGSAIVIAHLEEQGGLPWTGVSAADISLVDQNGQPVGDGPYFFGDLGDLLPPDPGTLASVASTTFAGAARIAFLNVPPGPSTLVVNTLEGEATTISVAPFEAIADGAVVERVIHSAAPPPPPAGTYTFTKDIHPMLQRASLGGEGCGTCHTAAGPAGGILRFDEAADVVYGVLMANPAYVNLASPAESLLLMRPLYETPPDHPNATWLTVEDPSYLKVLAWIEQGAPL